MKFCVRVDDLGWTDQVTAVDPIKEPDRGLRYAQFFHAAMSGAPYLGAVIPTALDSDGQAWLWSQPQGLTPAAHGWSHCRVDGVDSEFRNLSLDHIRVRLENARLLIGTVRHFVPPFNALEPNLPEAAYLEGTRYIWGAPSHWPTPPQPYPVGRLTLVPSWLPTYSVTEGRMSSQMKPLLETLPHLLKFPGQAVITLHIPWELAKTGPTFDGVRRMVALLGNRIISPEEYISGVI